MSSSRLKEHIGKLYAFRVVADHGSISKATHDVGLSQAALSHTIKVLEEAIGAPLFYRQPRGVSLTASGKRVYEFSKRLLMDLDSLEESLGLPEKEGTGKIRIGTHESLAIHVWPEFLGSFLKQYPKMEISLLSGRVHELTKSLLQREFHILFMVKPLMRPETEFYEMQRNNFGFYAGVEHEINRFPSLRKEKITLKEVKNIPLFSDVAADVEEGLSVPDLLQKNGFSLDKLFEINSFEAAIKLAAKGLGIAVLPWDNAAMPVQLGQIKPISIKGVKENDFGKYSLGATILKENSTNKNILLILRELNAFLRESSK